MTIKHITEIRISEITDNTDLTMHENEHLNSCEQCQELFEDYKLTHKQILNNIPDIDIPYDLENYILKGLETDVESVSYINNEKKYFLFSFIIASISIVSCFYFFPISLNINLSLNFSFIEKISSVISDKPFLLHSIIALFAVLGIERLFRKKRVNTP
jgi:hypothetical protein